MTLSIKSVFLGYLTQLQHIVTKIPEDCFAESLTNDMFSLEVNAQIAANFLLRGYCPLIDRSSELIELSGSGKDASLELLSRVRLQLQACPEFAEFDDSIVLQDKAGFADVMLPQSEFVLKYIIPNMLFHMSMVYAIARKSGANLSKGDFDGLHHYPAAFSFIT